MDENNLKPRRSIRDIPLNGNKQPYQKNNSTEINLKKIHANPVRKTINIDSDEEFAPKSPIKPRKRHIQINKNNCKPKFKFRFLYLVLILLTFAGLFLFGNLREKATLNISLRTLNFKASGIEFILVNEDSSDSNDLDIGLRYKKLNLNEEYRLSVKAEKEEMVKQKTKATITVYNEYSENSQNWIVNTRFKDENGKIYRAQENLTVPGYTTSNGKIIPGKIEIEVIADDFGDDYALKSGSRMTIPAFEGQDSHSKYYAIASNDVTVGFDGVRKVILEEDLDNAKVKLEESLKNILIEKISTKIPDNLIVLYNDESFTFNKIVQKAIDGQNVELSQEAELQLMVIEKEDLYQFFGKNHVPNFVDGDKISIKNLAEQELSLEVGTTNKLLVLNGDIVVEWQIDEDEIISKVLGKKASELKEVVENYKEISSVTSELDPFWKNSFPKKESRIKINFVN